MAQGPDPRRPAPYLAEAEADIAEANRLMVRANDQAALAAHLNQQAREARDRADALNHQASEIRDRVYQALFVRAARSIF